MQIHCLLCRHELHSGGAEAKSSTGLRKKVGPDLKHHAWIAATQISDPLFDGAIRSQIVVRDDYLGLLQIGEGSLEPRFLGLDCHVLREPQHLCGPKPLDGISELESYGSDKLALIQSRTEPERVPLVL